MMLVFSKRRILGGKPFFLHSESRGYWMHLFCIVQYTFICSGICYHTAVISIKDYYLRLLVWMLFATYGSSPFSAVSKVSCHSLH